MCTEKASWHGALPGDGLQRNSYKQHHPSEMDALVDLHAQPDDSSVPLEQLPNKKVGLLTQLHKLLWRFNIVYWRSPQYTLFRLMVTIVIVRLYSTYCLHIKSAFHPGPGFWQHVFWPGNQSGQRHPGYQQFRGSVLISTCFCMTFDVSFCHNTHRCYSWAIPTCLLSCQWLPYSGTCTITSTLRACTAQGRMQSHRSVLDVWLFQAVFIVWPTGPH